MPVFSLPTEHDDRSRHANMPVGLNQLTERDGHASYESLAPVAGDRANAKCPLGRQLRRRGCNRGLPARRGCAILALAIGEDLHQRAWLWISPSGTQERLVPHCGQVRGSGRPSLLCVIVLGGCQSSSLRRQQTLPSFSSETASLQSVSSCLTCRRSAVPIPRSAAMRADSMMPGPILWRERGWSCSARMAASICSIARRYVRGGCLNRQARRRPKTRATKSRGRSISEVCGG